MTIEITKGLRDLKLFGMATNWPEIVARGRHDALDPEELMRQLLEAEKADRIVHSIAYSGGGEGPAFVGEPRRDPCR